MVNVQPRFNFSDEIIILNFESPQVLERTVQFSKQTGLFLWSVNHKKKITDERSQIQNRTRPRAFVQNQHTRVLY